MAVLRFGYGGRLLACKPSSKLSPSLLTIILGSLGGNLASSCTLLLNLEASCGRGMATTPVIGGEEEDLIITWSVGLRAGREEP